MSLATPQWSGSAKLQQARHNSHHYMNNTSRETSYPSLLRTAGATWNPEQPAELRALLKHGSSPQQMDGQGNTCLHLLLSNAHPNQHWTVLALSTLLRAGVDPQQANDVGRTSIDVACDAPAALGSFRRDLLLQALLEGGLDVFDIRLLQSTELSSVYNDMRHQVLFGDRSNHSEFELRSVLLERLTELVDERNLNCNRKLFEPTLKRVLSARATATLDDSDAILQDSLRYLEKMRDGKKAIVSFCKERFRKEDHVRLGVNLNLLQMCEQANMAALLEYDWNRPVDLEDLFSSYADGLIEQLESLSPANGRVETIAELIDIIQNAVPSYHKSSELEQPRVEPIDRTDSGKCLAPLITKIADMQRSSWEDWPAGDGAGPNIPQRKESIAKTPVEFYRADPQ